MNFRLKTDQYMQGFNANTASDLITVGRLLTLKHAVRVNAV